MNSIITLVKDARSIPGFFKLTPANAAAEICMGPPAAATFLEDVDEDADDEPDDGGGAFTEEPGGGGGGGAFGPVGG